GKRAGAVASDPDPACEAARTLGQMGPSQASIAALEVANESNFTHSKDWQYHMIRYVKAYERGKPGQHPVGMTGYTQSDDQVMADSPADWISPGGTGHTHEDGPYKSDPPSADGKKVVLLDTDHIWGMGGGRDWVWKSFLRGHNPIGMDACETPSVWEPVPANAEDVRRSLGQM